jgi:hypothetical protein
MVQLGEQLPCSTQPALPGPYSSGDTHSMHAHAASTHAERSTLALLLSAEGSAGQVRHRADWRQAAVH